MLCFLLQFRKRLYIQTELCEMRYEEHGDLNKSVIIITMDIVDMCD